MLPLPNPVLNGHEISHAELRALHQNRRIAITGATAQYCFDGPRLLDPNAGERCEMRALGRDRAGSLLAQITSRCRLSAPATCARFVLYVGRIRTLS